MKTKWIYIVVKSNILYTQPKLLLFKCVSILVWTVLFVVMSFLKENNMERLFSMSTHWQHGAF